MYKMFIIMPNEIEFEKNMIIVTFCKVKLKKPRVSHKRLPRPTKNRIKEVVWSTN